MKVIGERTVFDGKHLKFIEQDIIKPNGKPGTWEKVSRLHPGVVGAFVEHTENGSIILVEQFRPPVNARVLELVAGVIDKPGKTNEEIIVEEIREETGYITKNVEFIMCGPKSPGMTDEISYDYYAQVSGVRKKQQLGESESIEVVEFEKRDLDKVIKSKESSGVLISPGIYVVLYKLLTTKDFSIK